jgi:hypothetical protein
MRNGILGEPLPDDLRQRLADLVSKIGERATLDRLQISRGTLSRALAGLGMQRGTHMLIRAALRVQP